MKRQRALLKIVVSTLFLAVMTMALTLGACGLSDDASSESSVEPHEHVAGEWIVDSAATCAAAGSKHIECTVCGEVLDTETIEKIPHAEVVHDAKAATCGEIGWDEYVTCENCDYTTYEEIPALGHNFENGLCTRCGRIDPDAGKDAYRTDGAYIYFGTYPQTDVTEIMSDALAEYVSEKPSNGNNNGWISYKYYINSNNETDYMWYKDVIHTDGSKYRAVYFTSYRPYWLDTSSSAGNSRQDENGYNTNKVYWFRFDEIKWRILGHDGNTATILADIILDSQNLKDVRKNNYANSDMRIWLNDMFYNTAFNDLQKALINTVTVDNGARSTNPDNNATYWNNGNNSYVSENTQDKVWLLSQQEATRAAYGFNTKPDSSDTARRKQASGYAKCQGTWVSDGDIGYWWLRSPHCSYDYRSRVVNNNGSSADYSVAINCSYGIAPALQITLNDIHEYTATDWITENEPTCTESGSHYKECAVCGDMLENEVIPALGHNFENGACTRCGAAEPAADKPAYRADGEYIYFGSYPQADVTESMATVLAEYATDLPSSGNNNGWNSYKYYADNANTTDYMWYKDVTHTDGNKYRGVYFTGYRFRYTGKSGSTDYTNQTDNGYNTNKVYWFRFDEIKWKVLSRADNTATILSELIIDSQDYNHASDNNYANSSLRAWLNDTFYNDAFSDLQKALIDTVEVDNSPKSTNPDNEPTKWSDGNNQYACANTQDKVWLLSQQEITRALYGFGTDSLVADTIRCKQASAYAKCQGIAVSDSGNSFWWLRSPAFTVGSHASSVTDGGCSNYAAYVYLCEFGIAPALQIKLS